RSCCTTHPRNSPTAASLVSVPRSELRPAASMPAGRSVSSSSPPSSTACAARARSGREPVLARLMARLPPHAPGMKIGLFGGTFDPPHQAHRAACLIAMRRLGLDRVWWLVTPGNPLKDTRDLSPLGERLAAARALAHHPRIDVTGFEAEIGSPYTYDTVRYLRERCPSVRFVWI